MHLLLYQCICFSISAFTSLPIHLLNYHCIYFTINAFTSLSVHLFHYQWIYFAISAFILLPVHSEDISSWRICYWRNENNSKNTNFLYLLLLKGFTGYKTSKELIFFPFPICLPPIRIFLADDMQNITFLKSHTKLSTWNV